MLTCAHFEHAAPILGELDLDVLLSTQARLSAGDESVLQDLMASLAINAKSRTFRRLAAVVGASVDELLESETNEAKMKFLEADAARLPFKEAVQRVFGFFSELVPSAGAIPDSFGNPTAQTNHPPMSAASPSADS